MAILGGGPGGGGPIGVSNTFTGPAEAIEVYGDFAAAYTGLHSASETGFEVLSFTTGNYLFVGEFQLNGAVSKSSPGDIVQTSATITFNGVDIAIITNGNASIDAPMSTTQDLIIPAYTEVTVTFDMTSTGADNFASGTLTGRIYRD